MLDHLRATAVLVVCVVVGHAYENVYYTDFPTGMYLQWTSSSGSAGQVEYLQSQAGINARDENGSGGMTRRLVFAPDNAVCEDFCPDKAPSEQKTCLTNSYKGQTPGIPYNNSIVLYVARRSRPCSWYYSMLRHPHNAGAAGALFMFEPEQPQNDGRIMHYGTNHKLQKNIDNGEPIVSYPIASVSREDVAGTAGALAMFQEVATGHSVQLFWPGSGKIVPTERAALKELYANLQLSWGTSKVGSSGGLTAAEFLADDTVDPCLHRLEGTTCIGGHVVSINFMKNSKVYVKDIPASISKLSKLKFFFSGFALWPDPSTNIPCSFWELVDLETFIWFNPSSHGGTLQLNQCAAYTSKLKMLILRDFIFKGELPPTVFAQKLVHTMILHGVKLPALPPVDAMKNLVTLELVDNDIGPAPLQPFNDKPFLKRIVLMGNIFTDTAGSFSHETAFDNCPSLQSVQLVGTRITKAFNFDGSTNLDYIDLSENMIETSIPESWKQLSKVVELKMNNNKISGLINGLLGMSSCKRLDLSHNAIENTHADGSGIYSEFKDWIRSFVPPSIEKLDVSYNKLRGGDSVLLGVVAATLSNLLMLDISHNMLSGHIWMLHLNYNFDMSFNDATHISTAAWSMGDTASPLKVLLAMDVSHQNKDISFGYEDTRWPSIDQALNESNAFVSSPMYPALDQGFQKIEYPAGSGVTPFSCPVWTGRRFPAVRFRIDPKAYGYTGGSTPEMRSRWFDDDVTDEYREAFLGNEGFCRCDAPYVGVPPNCVLSCGKSNVKLPGGNCIKCPLGAVCDEQSTELKQMPLAAGFWRMSSNTTEIRQCSKTKDWCQGGGPGAGFQGSAYCKEHHYGPYCKLCDDGYTMQDGSCVQCSSVGSVSRSLIVVLVGVVLLLGLGVLYKVSEAFRNVVAKFNTRGFIVKGKQILTYFQLVVLLPVVFLVPYPTEYLRFLEVFEFVNINVVQLFSFGCIKNWSYHSELLVAMLLPVAGATLIAIGTVITTLLKNSKKMKERRRIRQTGYAYFLIMLWCLYPFLNYTIFQAFNCESFSDGSSLLRADYNLNCESSTHKSVQNLAVFLIFVYPLGVPALFLKSMWPYRREFSVALSPGDFSKGDYLAFLCYDYKGSFWYWEIIELLRKSLLNGFCILILQGSIMQLVIALLVVLAHFAISLHSAPMVEISHNYLYYFVSICIFLTYLVSVLLKLQDGTTTAEYSFGYNPSTILGLLFSVSIAVLFTGVWAMVGDLNKAKSVRAIKFKETRQKVGMNWLPQGHHHCFLSHNHAEGADQCATIKYLLENLVVGIRCFLDIESLQSIDSGVNSLQDLPTLVKNSRNLILFMTKGVFERQWIQAEAASAVASGVNPILVQETDPHHGASAMNDLLKKCRDDLKAVLFSDDVIEWRRELHFKHISLMKIVQRLLMRQDFKKYKRPPSLYIEGEITMRAFGSPQLLPGCNSHIYISYSPHASKVANQLRLLVPDLVIVTAADDGDDTELSKLQRQKVIKTASSVMVLMTPELITHPRVLEDLITATDCGTKVIPVHDRTQTAEEKANKVALEFKEVHEACPIEVRNRKGIFDELNIDYYSEDDYIDVSLALMWRRIAMICDEDTALRSAKKHDHTVLRTLISELQQQGVGVANNKVAPVATSNVGVTQQNVQQRKDSAGQWQQGRGLVPTDEDIQNEQMLQDTLKEYELTDLTVD